MAMPVLDALSYDLLSDEFALALAAVGRRAREEALAAGHPVVFIDALGRCVQELPDGRQLEVLLQPGEPRESHIRVLRELPSASIR